MIQGLAIVRGVREMRLIDADALTTRIEEEHRRWGEDYDAHQILGDIEDAPTIEPCEDAISRAEVLKLIDEEYNDGRFLSEYESGRNSMNETIRRWTAQLPSVAPSRPSGEWIETFDDSRLASIRRYACSECGGEWLPEFIKRIRYCPCCGAKMSKESE